MNREELEHAIRTACQLTGKDRVIIIGSQSILGSFDGDVLPAEATESREVDVLPVADTHEEIVRLADLVSGVAGELSDYDDLHGFYLDGVDDTTATLPVDWKDRLVRVEGQGTMNILTGAICLGLCLEPHDLCVAKLCAHREKDTRFVAAIIKAGLVDPQLIADRLGNFEGKDKAAAAVAIQWLGKFLLA